MMPRRHCRNPRRPRPQVPIRQPAAPTPEQAARRRARCERVGEPGEAAEVAFPAYGELLSFLFLNVHGIGSIGIGVDFRFGWDV